MALTDAAANRLLEQEPWARERLAPYAGRTFIVRVGPVATAFGIDDRGLLLHAPLAGSKPDLVLTLSPLSLAPFLADPRRFHEFVTEEGDAELAAALAELAQTLPWFVERLFARALGPVVGQRVANAGRKLLEMPEYAATRIAANVGSYARDEAQLLAHPADLRTLADGTAALTTRVDALAERVDALGR
ncbi:MAG: SCP2 sterol-binding domain-containing protein [Rudaea sp.]